MNTSISFQQCSKGLKSIVEGGERSIGYTSWSLSETENKYSQIEKEDLSLVWWVKKFQIYLEGRHFTLVTNYQPLKYIMDPGKAVPVTAAAKIQRRCLFLGIFSYQIEFPRYQAACYL